MTYSQMEEELKLRREELERGAAWADKLLNYASANNRHILIKEYAQYLDPLLRAANQVLGKAEYLPGSVKENDR